MIIPETLECSMRVTKQLLQLDHKSMMKCLVFTMVLYSHTQNCLNSPTHQLQQCFVKRYETTVYPFPKQCDSRMYIPLNCKEPGMGRTEFTAFYTTHRCSRRLGYNKLLDETEPAIAFIINLIFLRWCKGGGAVEHQMLKIIHYQFRD